MYGAILGDIVGSRFEFDRTGWTKDFDFFGAGCNWTDDTVMTIAVAEALMSAGKDASVDEIEDACTKSMQKWGQRYPDAGYGAKFIFWVHANHPEPYMSFGNGSAMRVSSAGWLYDSLERTREVARATARVSHNHSEGIKGAECTAAVIYMARTGCSKEEIADYVVKEFGYDFSETLEEMRARHEHIETCQDSLPKALRSFFDGDSLEDVIRNAVSLGGDTDTLAAIAGAMAEGMYGIPVLYRGEVILRTEDDMRAVLGEFDKALHRIDQADLAWTEGEEEEEDYVENARLRAAYLLFHDEEDENKRAEMFITFLNELFRRIVEGGTVPAPFVDVHGDFFSEMQLDKIKLGETVTTKNPIRLKMDTMTDSEGNIWLPLFMNKEELSKGQTGNIISPVRIVDVLRMGLEREDLKGVVINPFGRAFTMPKELLDRFLKDYDAWTVENAKEG